MTENTRDLKECRVCRTEYTFTKNPEFALDSADPEYCSVRCYGEDHGYEKGFREDGNYDEPEEFQGYRVGQ